MYNITRLYPQYKTTGDRRQNNIPVAFERRSGQDRRSTDRVMLDTRLTRDIFEVKNKIAKLEALSPKLFQDNIIKHAPNFSETNNLKNDYYVKETKPDPTEIKRLEAKIEANQNLKFQIGLIAASLLGAVGLSFLSGVGAFIVLGTSIYLGGRVLATVFKEHLKDTDVDKNKKQ